MGSLPEQFGEFQRTLKSLNLQWLVMFCRMHPYSQNPYHNADFSIRTAMIAMNIWRQTCPKERRTRKGLAVTLVSALIADLGHMGGYELCDEMNIENMEVAVAFVKERLEKAHGDGFIDQCLAIARLTQKGAEVHNPSYEASVVLDAIFLTQLSMDSAPKLMEGLLEERRRRFGAAVDAYEHIAYLRKGFKTYKPHTTFAKAWLRMSQDVLVNMLYEYALKIQSPIQDTTEEG